MLQIQGSNILDLFPMPESNTAFFESTHFFLMGVVSFTYGGIVLSSNRALLHMMTQLERMIQVLPLLHEAVLHARANYRPRSIEGSWYGQPRDCRITSQQLSNPPSSSVCASNTAVVQPSPLEGVNRSSYADCFACIYLLIQVESRAKSLTRNAKKRNVLCYHNIT